MAIIGHIRKRMGWVLLAFVGMAMLAFILGDWSGTAGAFVGNRGNVIAEIGGVSVTFDQFERKKEERFATYRINTRQSTIDAATQDILSDEAWTQMVNEIVLGAEFEELGIAVSKDELDDMVRGNNIHPRVVDAFTNPQTGQFNKYEVTAQLQQMYQDPEMKSWWLLFEKGLISERLREKYTALIRKGIYVTTEEARLDYEENNARASITFVVKSYSDAPDSTIAVSDVDIRDYYEEHKEEYRQREEDRAVEYVVFDVLPSVEDSTEVAVWVHDIKDDFERSKDDSLFVNRNADTPFDHTYRSKGSYAAAIDSVVFASDTGTVIGPYFENNTYKLAKVMDIRQRPDSAKIRHLVIVAQGDTAAAYTRADSLKRLAENGAGFAELAFTNTEDPNSKADSGGTGWVMEDDPKIAFGKAFTDTCFTSGRGSFILFKAPYGTHVIHIEDQTGPVKQVLVGFLDRRIVPSSTTFNSVYSEASEFAGRNRSAKAFTAAAQDKKKRVADNLKAGDRHVAGLESPRELVRWAFNANPGTVSEVLSFGDKFVVAFLREVREKGYVPIEQKKPELEAGARKDKKAQKFAAELEKRLSSGDMDKIAAAVGEEAHKIESVSFASSFLVGLGQEPRLLGNISGMTAGRISAPIKGNAGVFVVKAEEIKTPETKTNFATEKSTVAANRRSTVDYGVIEALIRKADIRDNRPLFY